MIEVQDNRLIFSFPEVHPNAIFSLEFQRTLRIPDDNREYPLPPGLGGFPLHHVDDFAANVPAVWEKRGGVFLPMYQAEAMWILFGRNWDSSDIAYPFAVKIAAGKIDAVSGENWSLDLSQDPQNYLVIPEQPWLDGFSMRKGAIRQFVAMPLGEGYTAEEQISGEAQHGGIQFMAFPMRKTHYEELLRRWRREREDVLLHEEALATPAPDMGLAPGGLMRQEIYEDPYGIEVWDTGVRSRCFVHIANSLAYQKITSSLPPTRPPTAADYTEAGLPWFDYFDAELKVLQGSAELAGLDSVAAKGIKKGEEPLPENAPVIPKDVRRISKKKKLVREGDF